jgi:hypothetical protein
MNVSIVTIIHGDKEFIPLIKYNYNNIRKDKENIDIFIIDDGNHDLSDDFKGLYNCNYIHLDNNDKSNFYEKIKESIKKEDLLNINKINFEKKKNILPNGFLRDYACGLSDKDYIFHMNKDCIYNPKSLIRKESYLSKNRIDCVYCDKMLCYDIYNKDIYKSESSFKIYEGTLFHSKEFWKFKGFNWYDINNEANMFQYSNDNSRILDNYYDTIQLLHIHNMNQYNPIKIELEGININIPELINDLNINEHPFKKILIY